MQKKKKINEVIIITGPSGAGKTTAINVLEDIGFEPIDNIPIELISRLLSGPNLVKPLAIGIDIRTRDFSSENLLQAIDSWKSLGKVSVSLLYLDCEKHELEQRFNGTRRRHPLSSNNTLESAIMAENELIKTLKSKADILLDTSKLNPNGLKAQLIKFLGYFEDNNMGLTFQSFSFKRSVPPGVDMALDCRFLGNPFWIPELRDLTGKDKAVSDYLMQDKNWPIFFVKTIDLLKFLLPTYQGAGKAYFQIGFGCSGGRHRSVFSAETIAAELRKSGWILSIDHRELIRSDIASQ
jgi:UPF0042 nucleotide-binding protein